MITHLNGVQSHQAETWVTEKWAAEYLLVQFV